MFGVKGDFEMVQAFHFESNIYEVSPPDPSQPGRRSISYDKLFFKMSEFWTIKALGVVLGATLNCLPVESQ
jgi:hypothetical protein